MIFLDVGGHDGQTLEEVVKPQYMFGKIYCFEPMPTQYGHLVRRFSDNPRVTLLNYGLADSTGERPVYGSNDNMESSVYADKRDVDADVVTSCYFVEATEFFLTHVPDGTSVVMKLNCEGSEIMILNNLMDTGEINKIANVMIDFDIRKVPGREHEEQALLQRLTSVIPDHHSLCDQVMVGKTHQARISNWLAGVL